LRARWGAAEDEVDDLGDVGRGDLCLAVEQLDALPVSSWVMWFGGSVATAAGSIWVTLMSGSSSWRGAWNDEAHNHALVAHITQPR
jgi:hypothetical protein